MIKIEIHFIYFEITIKVVKEKDNMKKIAVLFILLLCICACTKPKEPTVEPQPLEPTVIKEKEYILSDGWVAQDFRFEDHEPSSSDG